MIVVDASLAAKLIFAEPGSAAALAFVADHPGHLCGPDLLLNEVCGAIVRRANQDKAWARFAQEALTRWTDGWDTVFIAHRLTPERARQAAALALAIAHPLADCIYLALAIELGCDLVTCDAKFRERAIGRYPAIRLLGG